MQLLKPFLFFNFAHGLELLSSSLNCQQPVSCPASVISLTVADKMGIDDSFRVNHEDIEFLETVGNSVDFYQGSSPKEEDNQSRSGHLLAILKGGNSDETWRMFWSQNGFCTALESESNGAVDGDEISRLLQNNGFAQQVASENVRVYSDKLENEVNDKLGQFKLTDGEIGGMSKPITSSYHEKLVYQLKYLRNLLQQADEGKYYGVITIDLNKLGEHQYDVLTELVNAASSAQSHYIETTILRQEDSSSAMSFVAKQYKEKTFKRKTEKTKLSGKSVFPTEEECIIGTNNCNTHGLCSKNSGSRKWSCMCSSSFNKTSKSTTHWSGSSCEKIDISAEFNLLFWSSFVMLSTVIGAVVLIFKMDSEPLPGILSAATSGSFKN